MSAITGVDENLIYKFAMVFQAIASGENVNVEKFACYMTETSELFVTLYPWY